VLAVNVEFVQQMPADWDGDPLTDACDEARDVFAKLGIAP
jgi:hypothetical protein